MNILQTIPENIHALKWFDEENITESNAFRKEIYLIAPDDYCKDLKSLFYNLFTPFLNDILIYDASWWDFTLDTWNIHTNTYDYSSTNKSSETIQYLNMLKDSQIPTGYSGSCKCDDWECFLDIILLCIINHVAPYSPRLYSVKNNFLFYFHHTGSIGFYHSKNSNPISSLLEKAAQYYKIVSY